MRFILSICVLIASAVPAAALDDPNRLVRQLYKLPSVPTQHQEIDRFFSEDMAAAIKQDLSRPAGDYGRADWRFDGVDTRIADLIVGGRTRFNPLITTDFVRDGRRSSVSYEMCWGSRGWRISNVRHKGGNLRSTLEIPTAPVSC